MRSTLFDERASSYEGSQDGQNDEEERRPHFVSQENKETKAGEGQWDKEKTDI